MIVRDHPLGFLGHRAGVDPEQPGHDVGRVGHAAADRIDQAQLVADDPAQAVAKARPAAEDVVEDDQGVEVGMVPSDPQVAQHDVDLLAGMMDAADARSSGLGHRRATVAGAGRAAPSRRSVP